jgi:hypothetical protein
MFIQHIYHFQKEVNINNYWPVAGDSILGKVRARYLFAAASGLGLQPTCKYL